MISTHRRSAYRLCMLALCALAACGDSRITEYQLSGPTMGTRFNVIVATASDFDQQDLQTRIHAVLEDIDQQMSTYRPDSELANFNRSQSTEPIPVTRRLCEAVDKALQLSDLSSGTFDITVGPLVNLWGFGPTGSRTVPPSDDAIVRTRSRTGREKLHPDCDRSAIRKDHAELEIDLSGYAKGLAADEIAALLDEAGMVNYLVEIGGDLRTRGQNASLANWRIAIESPETSVSGIEKIIHISDLAVATSGDYRNYFEYEGRRYSHTIDPRTGRPVAHDLASVTVLAASAAYADAMATALLVLGPDVGSAFAEQESIAAYFLFRDGSGIDEWTSTKFSAIAEP